jgi:hypothetical protein
MIKILRTTIVCLLIPALVFAQIPQYRGNAPSVKQTDLSRVLNALNTQVGQQIVSYIETTVGSIDLEHAKAFTTTGGEVAFVPIRTFNNELMVLCYRQLENGSKFLFLLTYKSGEKALSFSFPSGQMYLMKSSGFEKSTNPDFQFQQYDDLQNKVSTSELSQLDKIVCLPVAAFNTLLVYTVLPIARIISFFYFGDADSPYAMIISIFLALPLIFIFPVLLIYTIYTTYPDNSNLKLLSVLFAIYFYSCFQPDIAFI